MAILMIDAGVSAPDAAGTRVGGVPLVSGEFSWPTCRECPGALQFVTQIELGPGPAGLLSIFMCDHRPGECETWSPTSGANQVFVFTGPLRPAAEPELVAPARAVRLVEIRADDHPDAVAEEAAELGDEPVNDYDVARRVWWDRPDHEDVLGQLGGEPSWYQYEEIPDCPGCERPMTFAAQLEESGFNFGTGEAYAFWCPACGTGAFLWQC